jgi:heptosyltransferase-2
MFAFEGLRPDCRRFRSDRPCEPHKQRGVTCPTCDVYDPAGARVLVVKLAALGDVLRTTGLLPAIHAAFPRAHVTWLTSPEAVPLFAGNPLVDEVWSTEGAVTSSLLAQVPFDAVLCPDTDQATVALAAAARAREQRGFTLDGAGRVVPLGPDAEHWYRMGISDHLKRANRETYQTLVARALGLDPSLVAAPMLRPTEADRQHARELREQIGFRGPLVGLNVGAAGRWEYKEWTFENQCDFLQRASAEGTGVLLLGGPKERERMAKLIAASRGLPVFDSGCDNSFGRFAALVELCGAVVTGDTFAMHVATARGVPAVVLFGPTSAAEIELFGRGTKISPTDLDCLVCYLPRCDVRPHCQARISADQVWMAVTAHLQRRTG